MFEGLQDKPAYAWLKELRRAFPKARAYLVGGVVRDAMLGRPSKDEDFVIGGVAEKDLEAFLKKHGRADFVGRTFGVCKFTPQGSETAIDIALPRTETPMGTGGYHDVETQSDPALPIEKDLARRDFTINAIAWDIFEAKLIDPFHGVEDVNGRSLRAVGDAGERFSEDLTRVLRALRLAVTLGFSIEHETTHAIEEAATRLNARRESGARLVPHQVMAREWLKSLQADTARALALWHASGALRVVLPELEAVQGEAAQVVGRLPRDVGMEATLAALFLPYKDGRVAQATLERIRATAVDGFSIDPARVGRIVDAATFLHDHEPAKTPLIEAEERALDVASEALAVAWAGGATTKAIGAWKKRLEACAQPPLLTGAEVQEVLSLNGPSPEIGRILRALRAAQLEGKVSGHEDAVAYVRHSLR